MPHTNVLGRHFQRKKHKQPSRRWASKMKNPPLQVLQEADVFLRRVVNVRSPPSRG